MLGIILCVLGTIMIFKNFENDHSIKLLGAAWLFMGTMLVFFYLRYSF